MEHFYFYASHFQIESSREESFLLLNLNKMKNGESISFYYSEPVYL